MQLHRTTCNRDCPDACAVLAEVEGGRVVRLRGDPAHPVTRGFLCSQGRDFVQRQNSPDRLLHPMERTASGWRRVSWDSALDQIAERMLRVRDESGPLSVLAVRYSGLRGRVQKAMTRLFWGHFGGATTVTGGTCTESMDAAQRLDFGPRTRLAHPPDDIVNSAGIVLWGRNLAVTHQHWIPFLDAAKRKGARVVLIDPVRTASANRADRHLAIRPGTDRLLALAVARIVIESGSFDAGFVREHTLGFEAFRALCQRWSLEETALATDLPRAAIEELASLYGQHRPVSTLVGLGLCGWKHAGETVRAIDALVALSGNLGIAGGGVTGDIDYVAGLDDVDIGVPEVKGTRTIRLPMLGDEILRTTAPPLRLGWVAGANPAATAPNPDRVQQGLQSLEYLVVVEQFMTATAELADMVLPCTTWLESDDLVSSYGHDELGLCAAVVAPPGEARSDVEIFQGLAGRLGFGPALAGNADLWMRRLLRSLEGSGVDLDRLRQGAVHNPRAPRIPLADKVFGTPSGKMELVQACAPPDEPVAGALHLMATKTLRTINHQVLDEDLSDKPVARVHPTTLQSWGLEDGAEGWVVSSAGRIRALIQADASIRADLVLVNPGVWKGDPCGVNQLREVLLTDVGDCAAMHETRVTLERLV
ncbi:MAG: molybdopterin-dependent oxidoreductase [Deltaproteobacteria bacterium]|nr:molybdopterin-dependent oxidoreductase [Deltaproteobacteria bacterium]